MGKNKPAISRGFKRGDLKQPEEDDVLGGFMLSICGEDGGGRVSIIKIFPFFNDGDT